MQQNGSFRLAETKTTRLVLGEPDQQLFEIAPDLVKMKPSQAQRRLWETLNLPQMSPDEKAALIEQVERERADADRRYEGKVK